MSIVYKHRGSIVYVYEKKSYRDKKTKQPRSKWKLLGKLDEATGQIVSTSKNTTTENVVVQQLQNQNPDASTLKICSSTREVKCSNNKQKEKFKMTKRQYAFTSDARAINTLQNMRQKDMDIEETFDNEGIRKGGIITLDGIEIKLGNIDRVSWNVGARKLLDIVLTRITKLLPYDNPTPENIVKIFCVKITLDEYMQICGLKDRRNAREQFRAAAEALINIYMKFDYLKYFNNRRKKPVLVHFNYHLFEGFDETRTLNVDPIVHSEINFGMSIRVLEYLGARRLSPLNFKIFLINSHKHPHAYNMARKMFEHYNLNVDKGPVRLSVASLWEGCPDLPRNEEVQGRHHRQLILEPFDRDLSALSDIYGLVDLHYCNEGGEPLTDEQLANYSFEDWKNWLIEFTLPDYPPREAPQKRGRPGKSKILAL